MTSEATKGARTLCFPWQRRWRAFGVVRVVIGLLLISAAVLKAYAGWIGMPGENTLLNSRWLAVAATEWELALGTLLLLGLWSRVARWMAIVSFTVFAGATAVKIWHGAASCGCFGRLSIAPHYTLVLDVLCLAALMLTYPHSTSRRITLRTLSTIGVVVSAGMVIGAIILINPPRQLANNLISSSWRDGELVVLDPAEWVGRSLPIMNEISISESLRDGTWLAILYHYDCHTCQRAVPVYAKLANAQAGNESGLRVALISVPPYAPPGKDIAVGSTDAAQGRLSQRFDWFIQSPTVLLLHDDKVLGEASGEDVLSSEWDLRWRGLLLKTHLGKPLQIEGAALAGEHFTTSAWRGKVVVIDFWATWCGPCRQSIPELAAIYQKYHHQGLEVLGVSLDTSAQQLRRFVAEPNYRHQMPWPQLYEPGMWQSPVPARLGIVKLPTVLVINRAGILTAVDPDNELEQVVRVCLDDPPPTSER